MAFFVVSINLLLCSSTRSNTRKVVGLFLTLYLEALSYMVYKWMYFHEYFMLFSVLPCLSVVVCLYHDRRATPHNFV